MNDKKNIERLFQEKFKDFEVAPPSGVWDGIASQLEKKKEKKKIFPFWFNAKAAGIAAALVLGFFTLNNNQGWVKWNLSDQKNTIDSNNQSVVEKNNSTQNNNTVISTKEQYPADATNILPQHKAPLVVSETKEKQGMQSSQNSVVTVTAEHTKIQYNSKYSKSNQSVTNPYIENNKLDTPDPIAHTSEKTSKSSLKNPNRSVLSEQLAENNNQDNQGQKNNSKTNITNDKNRNIVVKETLTDNNNHQDNLAVSDKSAKNKKSDKNKIGSDNSIANTVEKRHQNNDSSNEFLNKLKEMDSNEKEDFNLNRKKNSGIVQNNKNQLGKEFKDSVVVAQSEENPLEKILREKEAKKENKEEEIAENPYSKWGVRPAIAALFSGASNGSPISSEFADNEKTFDSKFGFGIGVDYQLNKKITIRSGISKVDMAYNTEGISFYTDLSGKMASQQNMQNINRNSASVHMVIQDRSRTPSLEIALAGSDTGVLNQQIGYIEVPMEISYKVIDKRFGLNFITGVSTLFLSDNKISIMSDGMTTEVGEANNLNKVHFSTNIGIGLKYNILKSLEASVEPMFKYQINTFSNDSGSFRPFVMGVYSGFRYKF